jgi:peptidoglycan/LPS O-acetylase OafA/YrhL
VVWSSIFFALIYPGPSAGLTMREYVRNLLVGYPYHFVPLLVFWYLATPAVVRIGRRRGALLLVCIAAAQLWWLILQSPEMFGLGGALPSWAARTAPPVLRAPLSDWAIYFPLGLVMSLHGAALKPRLERWRRTALTATAILFAAGLLNAFSLLAAPWARFIAPVPLMFVLPVVDRGSIPLLKFFEWLGRRSYGIYLAHFVIINGIVLLAGAWLAGRPLVVFPVFLVATLGLSLLLMEALTRARIGRQIYRHVFGIVAPPLPQRRVVPSGA